MHRNVHSSTQEFYNQTRVPSGKSLLEDERERDCLFETRSDDSYVYEVLVAMTRTRGLKINKCAAAVKTTLKMMIALAIVHSIGAVQGDAVKQLPGWSNALPSAMYSGK